MKPGLLFTISAFVAASASPGAIAVETLKDSDKKFMTTAATDGLAEVKIGQLAESKAGSTGVKDFALDMVKDHSKANGELKAIARKKRFPLPTKLDAKHQELYEKLSKLNGADFDKTYMDEMVTGHKEVVALLTDESNSSDPTLKDWAAKTLPTIQHHLEHANLVDTKVNKK